MFRDENTSEIIGFLNSIIKNNKVNDYQTLYDEALVELKNRSPILSILYAYYKNFEAE